MKNVRQITRLSKIFPLRVEVLHHNRQIISERENIGSQRWLLKVSQGISIKLSKLTQVRSIA
ncbi:Hypothetical protein EFER_1441 [Escherichia fergusonii ATCC 35469]|uniref:Uncharacterized protein n=1 Tax=Escherichia fergusonii (strain ATCC 35469 / DSM 13698 / CCUG 18766 / IAM 14443 / JCM 21226 / LMG 7866 / NBRC 102419 / NCTC 12128 / CDC 0568-73) TaxID=585054 RepID=B7LQR8_ESCF3|nr:hypothetical protein DKG79_08405 [Escherichia fergusonii]PQI94144.1 hypothetical protein C5U38_22835 [Escherichia fergusonii]PQJ02082.1 hypothetical protein C5U37_07465 [Escherichia fergusonii]CAQ88961.1 Hypothetical protein EFER_1441 [Escherichia fergusonii ATCC 35469]